MGCRPLPWVTCPFCSRRGPSTPEVLSTQRPGRRSGRRVPRLGGFSPGGPWSAASSPGNTGTRHSAGPAPSGRHLERRAWGTRVLHRERGGGPCRGFCPVGAGRVGIGTSSTESWAPWPPAGPAGLGPLSLRLTAELVAVTSVGLCSVPGRKPRP